jgi:hypothetical protein
MTKNLCRTYNTKIQSDVTNFVFRVHRHLNKHVVTGCRRAHVDVVVREQERDASGRRDVSGEPDHGSADASAGPRHDDAYHGPCNIGPNWAILITCHEKNR